MKMAMPMPDKRFHGLLLFHNVHLAGSASLERRLATDVRVVPQQLDKFDGLVTLTARQRSDIQQRVGARNNIFTVSNPSRSRRCPSRGRSVSPRPFGSFLRFETQKRLDHAVRAFALVVAERPQAKLEIFGRGALRPVRRAADRRTRDDRPHHADGLEPGRRATRCGRPPAS
jgi:glycosyltransferase involved in cell wall biosynthesis